MSAFFSVAASMLAPERSARARRRYDDPTVVYRAVEDQGVVGLREPAVADVDGVVTDL